MEKVLISACLLGDKCRYDGKDNLIEDLMELSSYFELVPFCSELEGGLKTPRLPSEIKKGQVRNNKGEDVTSNFYRGAEKAFNICSFLGIKLAILKENSPSCGVHKIHNGKFDGNLIDGEGVTTSFLRRKGIKVINETEAIELLHSIKENEQERLKISIEKRKQDEEGPVKRKPFDKNENFAKRVAKKDEDSSTKEEKKPFRKSFDRKERPFKKDGYKKPGFKKDEFKKDGFKKDGFKKPYRKKDEEGSGKPDFKKKSFSKKPYTKKEGFKGERKSYSKEPRKDYTSTSNRNFRKPMNRDKKYGNKDKE